MRFPTSLSTRGILALVALLLFAPLRSYASSMSLESDAGRSFYGMDDSGHVVFQYANAAFPSTHCSASLAICYETVDTTSHTTTFTDLAPTYAWDYISGSCVFPFPGAGPCTIANKGWTAVISGIAPEQLFGHFGSNTPQLLASGGFGGIFAVNGVGDVVFDDGLGDLWAEAVIPTPTPEPSTLLLLATGTIALAGFATFRRRSIA